MEGMGGGGGERTQPPLHAIHLCSPLRPSLNSGNEIVSVFCAATIAVLFTQQKREGVGQQGGALMSESWSVCKGE